MASLRAGNLGEAVARIDEAIDTAHKLGNDWEEGLALSIKAAGMARLAMLREAQRTYEAALDVLRDNNGWGVAQVRVGLGGVARARGDYQAAISHYQGALSLYQEIDARPEIARCLAGIASVALIQGDLGLCRASLTESLALSLATGQRLPVARGLEAFAALEARAGDAERAARLRPAPRSSCGPRRGTRPRPGLARGWRTCSAPPAGPWANCARPACWKRAARWARTRPSSMRSEPRRPDARQWRRGRRWLAAVPAAGRGR